MDESPTDWMRLIEEVDEVKTLLSSRGITEGVNANDILHRLEQRNKECGRVNAVVDEIVSVQNSEEPEVIVVDQKEDSSDVQLLFHADKDCKPASVSIGEASLPATNHLSIRGLKRPFNCVSPSEEKRALSYLAWRNILEAEDIIPLENPLLEEVATPPSEDAALPNEIADPLKLRDQLSYLLGMFPHVEHGYLKQIILNCRGDEVELNAFVTRALENRIVLPTVHGHHQPTSNIDDGTLPSCSKAIAGAVTEEVRIPHIGQQASSSQLISVEADSTTPTIHVEKGALVTVKAGEERALSIGVDDVPGVSSSINLPANGPAQDGKDDNIENEKMDDIKKFMLYSQQLEYLIGVLPDADPGFLEEKISEFEGNEDKLKEFVTVAIESTGGHKIYRTRGETQQQQEHEAQIMKFTKNFSVEDFLEVFPDPVAHFENNQRIPDLNMRGHCLAYLKGRYKYLYAHIIGEVFRRENFNLSRTVKELDKQKRVQRKTKRSASDCKMPEKQSVSFLQEVAYIENKDLINCFLEAKRIGRQQKFEMAKTNNELLTCNCCFDDELLSEDMSSCSDGHLFCVQCIKKGAEVIIGDGKSSFPCMQTDCKAEFSLSTLQGVLSPSVFGKLVMRLQAEEINAAGIEGLETCPSCPYSTIPAPEDKVFKCLNPECMKETCRNCKEPSHIPLKCEEVEKSNEVQARTYIENKMTEALIRTCWKCNRKFIKESGCNKMVCTCGATMCYICRQPVKDYKHFNPHKDKSSTLCPLYSDDKDLHVEPVKAEAAKAKEEIMRQYPRMDLKHDPTLKLPETPSSSKGRRHPAANPFHVDPTDYDVDELLINMNERYRNHRRELRALQRQAYLDVVNELLGDMPQMRDHGYNIPPLYEILPAVQVPQVQHVPPMEHVPAIAHAHPIPPIAHAHPVPPIAHAHPVPPIAHAHPVPRVPHNHPIPHDHQIPCVPDAHPIPHVHPIPHGHPIPRVPPIAHLPANHEFPLFHHGSQPHAPQNIPQYPVALNNAPLADTRPVQQVKNQSVRNGMYPPTAGNLTSSNSSLH